DERARIASASASLPIGATLLPRGHDRRLGQGLACLHLLSPRALPATRVRRATRTSLAAFVRRGARPHRRRGRSPLLRTSSSLGDASARASLGRRASDE